MSPFESLPFEPFGAGRMAGVGALGDENLLRTLRQYKAQVAKRYRALPPDQLLEGLPEKGLWISPKLDGELWFLVKQGAHVALCATNGRVIVDTPLVIEAQEALAAEGDVIIAGELVAAPADSSGRPRSHHVSQALGSEPREGALSFHPFDLVVQESEGAEGDRWERRLERLRGWFATSDRVRTVQVEEGGRKEAERLFQEWVLSEEHEGIVVRSDGGLTFKIKRTLTIDAVVIAYGERVVDDVAEVRELTLAVLRPDGGYQMIGTVGNGFAAERVAWRQRLEALQVPSAFRLANREGTLCRFVRPKVVVEVRGSDLLALDAWDRPIVRMALSYDEERGWAPTGEAPTAVILHPVFLRERSDKIVDEGDVGHHQLLRHVPLEAAAAPEPRAPSEIVARAVFTKVTKGKTAIRKYLLVQTHDEEGERYAPWLAFFTDYSAGRKEPLQTALVTGGQREAVEREVRAWMVEKLKRGWGEVAEARRGETVTPPEDVAKILDAEAKKRAKG